MNLTRMIILYLLSGLLADAQTQVRITGMQRKSESQVLELMGDRLVHVKASPAIPPLADDAAFLLRRMLRNDGYSDVRVDWRIPHAQEITLIVNEGRRLSLGEVIVEGMDSQDARHLARMYAAQAEKNRPHALGSPPFREEDVDQGLANIRQELNSRGYWSARATITTRETDLRGNVDLTIQVIAGTRYRIGFPVVTSVDGRGVKLTTGAVSPFAGRPATTANLNAMRTAAEELAVSRGYPTAHIGMGSRLESGDFIPVFSVDLGQRVRLNKITIVGNQITNPERIHSRVGRMEGDWYDESTMNKRIRELLATGAFQSVRVETESAGHRLVDATLHLQESRAREVSLAAGFGSYQGFIGRASYANRNFLGNLWGLTSGFEFGSRGVLGDVRLTDPWVGGRDVAATARAYAMIYGREGYDTWESGVEGWLHWKLGDHYGVELLFGTSMVDLTSDGLPGFVLGEDAYAHPRLRLKQTWDYRDNPVLPTRGWHLESPLQVGAAVGDVSVAYVMTGISGGWYHKLNRHYDIGLGGEWRMLVPSGDGGDLPIDIRLFNGGPRSVRSFPERELGPSVNGYPTGGEFMWNSNLELIRNFGGALKAVAFVDAGALSRNHEDAGEMEVAAGLGLRFDLPIGPIRLEYGYNLTRDSGEPNGTLHFAIGGAF